ncbi:Uncharacterized membrane protein [Paramicrobacterium humi]|uniref:Uncharacterized membrane protein n=1 Tax=Paramicrobacterium humi TaxID=640635 RepID=A0A1H4PZU4_9MICO|nr:TMEM175 family protein [Microbacterium humi]SEC12841.1 Uncharacterized membrane protein [Microbacterium humi]
MSSDGAAQESAETYGLGRIEAFSDGVIAVAITLLILDLRVPEPEEGASLANRFGDMWPNYLAYVISFLAIGIMWINHHAALRRLRSADHSVVIVNLILLLCIVTLPFSTSLFATYLTEPQGGHLAAVIYAGSFLVTSSVFLALQYLILWRPATSPPRPDDDPSAAAAASSQRDRRPCLPHRCAARIGEPLPHVGDLHPARALLPASPAAGSPARRRRTTTRGRRRLNRPAVPNRAGRQLRQRQNG